MKRLINIFKYSTLISIMGLYSLSAFGSFPEEHIIVLTDEKGDTNKLLDKAIGQSIVRILGSKDEYDKNYSFLKNINTKEYIKEYEFLDDSGNSKIKIVIDSRALRKHLLDNNLSITSEDKQAISAWILCKADLKSKSNFDQIKKNCLELKRSLLVLAEQRNVDLFFPILDTLDISFLELEQKDQLNNSSYLNNRYNTDGSIYCEATLNGNNCFKTLDSIKNNTKIDFDKKFTFSEIFNLVADSIQESKKISINKDSFKPILIEVRNLESTEDYDYAVYELKKIVLLNNLKIISLDNGSTFFSGNLMGKITDLEKLLSKSKTFAINSLNYKKVVIQFNKIPNALSNS